MLARLVESTFIVLNTPRVEAWCNYLQPVRGNSRQLSTVLRCGCAGELPENPGEMLAGGEAAILRYLANTSVRVFQQH